MADTAPAKKPRARSTAPKASKKERRKRLLIFIVAYRAESTLDWVLSRIPETISEHLDVEVLVIDDASGDKTFETGIAAQQSGDHRFPITVLVNPVNQGYGGNQKIGYRFASDNGFDFVALVHGDGQYAPEELPNLIQPLLDGNADAVFGSRMMEAGDALKGGMPYYKYVGNKVLTRFQNFVLGSDLTEFHSGYRLYSVKALSRVPYHLNTNDFHFDTEIIVQFFRAGLKIAELPIPTYYGDEICHVNGLKYAGDVTVTVLKSRLQDVELLYDKKFDCRPGTLEGNTHYKPKFGFRSPHQLAVDRVAKGSRVLDLGCAGGYVSAHLEAEKDCTVTGVDLFPLADGVTLSEFHLRNLDEGLPELDYAAFDSVVMLDVIEHLAEPEEFVDGMREAFKENTDVDIIMSTGNVAFILTRLSLLFGQFNYGKRGILDMTHKRLLTLASLKALLAQRGFEITSVCAAPVPWPLAFGDNGFSRMLLWLNGLACRLLPRLFGYQIILTCKPKPHLASLLKTTIEHSEERRGKAVA